MENQLSSAIYLIYVLHIFERKTEKYWNYGARHLIFFDFEGYVIQESE